MEGPAERPRLRRALLVAGSVLARLLLVLPVLFAFGAILAPGGAAATAVAAAFLAGSLAVLVLVRPLWKSALVTAATVGAVLAWFHAQAPRNDRNWQVDVSRPPRIERSGDRVVVRDLRDFDWTGPETANPRWTTRELDLSKLDSLWLGLSYWDGNTSICHTMLSFGFSDGQHLAVSVETRKEVGEEYSAWRGFFRQFELIYVLADERDVIGVRAAHRAEDLYLYELRSAPGARRRLLDDILATAADLAERPQWYGALRKNCTTTLQSHVDTALGRPARFHWETVFNGRIDEAGWRAGAIAGEPPFPAVRSAHRITEAARAATGRPDFARAVRQGLGAR